MRNHNQNILQTNGLIVPTDFPNTQYEAVHKIIESTQSGHDLYEHYSGAWNALAYRFCASIDSGNIFVASLRTHGATPPPQERYTQERALFEFYSSGFSVFESTFYGLYTIGAFLEPSVFSLSSQRDQQRVSPSRARDAFTLAFPRDPILDTFTSIFGHQEYQRWREVRNVLTHRAAPGRRLYVSLGSEDTPLTEWKLNNTPLDESIATTGRQNLSRLLTDLLTGAAHFVATRFKEK